jgi:uncharacterized ubiquitin-like protein YukD
VLRELSIRAYKNQTFQLRLSKQQAIKGVQMVGRQLSRFIAVAY